MSPHHPEPVSPELVLVDPELAARVRPVAVVGPPLPTPSRTAPPVERVQPPDTAAARDLPAETPEPRLRPPAPRSELPQHAPVRRRATAGRRAAPVTRRRRIPVSSVVVATAGLALLGAAFLPPRQAPRLADGAPAAVAAEPSPPATTGVEGPLLLWPATPGATYYAIELYAGARLAHGETIRGTRFTVPGWLSPGRYTWRVFAGRGRPSERVLEGPIERGWFLRAP